MTCPPRPPAQDRRAHRKGPLHYFMRALAIMRARFFLRRAELGPRVGVGGRLEASIRGTCRIGDRTTFRGGMLPTLVSVEPGGELSIGERCVFNFGAFIEAEERVVIGSNCMFASMVRIADRDGERAGPIVIGDGVWVAHGAVILPGVEIGSGSVVSAGSVVTNDVPPGAIAIGNPARTAPLRLVAPGVVPPIPFE